MEQPIDSFVIMSGKRLIQLVYNPQVPHKKWVIQVYYMATKTRQVLLSTSEYVDEEVARKDFEIRRPNIREDFEEVPMQRGKRLVQELLVEKLGKRS